MRIASPLEQIQDHGPAEACGCGHAHSHVSTQLGRSLLGLVFIFNSFLFDWISPENSPVAAASAMIGSLLLGVPIIWVAFQNLGRGALNTSVLVALAVFALFASAHYQEAGMVAFFMLLGQIIESRTAEGALASIHSLIKLTPSKARRIVGDQEEEVPVQSLAVGDLIRLRPGDHVAADGVVVGGQSSLNEANITGESLPVDKGAGDEVFAGTVNLTGLLEVRVGRAGQDSALNRVRELILAAEKTRLPITRIIGQHKVDYVRQARRLGYRVAVVGDGVNDAPALAAGDLGIAMGAAGSDVAIHSATIALMNNDLRRIPFLVLLSRATRRVIGQNFLVGLGFVMGGMVMGTLGFIDPIVAAVFHVTGSLMVVFNSFRLLRQGEDLEPLGPESIDADATGPVAAGSMPAAGGLAHP